MTSCSLYHNTDPSAYSAPQYAIYAYDLKQYQP